MSETTITIPLRVLEDFQKGCLEGLQPKVKFSDKPEEMLKEAYIIRGNKLQIINQVIYNYIPSK